MVTPTKEERMVKQLVFVILCSIVLFAAWYSPFPFWKDAEEKASILRGTRNIGIVSIIQWPALFFLYQSLGADYVQEGGIFSSFLALAAPCWFLLWRRFEKTEIP